MVPKVKNSKISYYNKINIKPAQRYFYLYSYDLLNMNKLGHLRRVSLRICAELSFSPYRKARVQSFQN